MYFKSNQSLEATARLLEKLVEVGKKGFLDNNAQMNNIH